MKVDLRTSFIWRVLITPLAWVYRVLYYLRAFYAWGWVQPYQAKIPVISVGNLSVGGTGKTPLIDWLVGYLEEEGFKVGLLSRGYRRQTTESLLLRPGAKTLGGPEFYGDEPWFLAGKHPRLTLAIDSRRDRGSREIEGEVDLLLLDDGFQQLYQKVDLNLVLFDASFGLGNGGLLPAGPLREPLSALKRADALVLTKTNLGDPRNLQNRLAPHLPNGVPTFHLVYQPVGVLDWDQRQLLKLDSLPQVRWLAFCGIGNPMGFRRALNEAGIEPCDFIVLADHQHFDLGLAESLKERAQKMGAVLIGTQKDGVKLDNLKNSLGPVYLLVMELGVPEEFKTFIKQKLAKKEPGA